MGSSSSSSQQQTSSQDNRGVADNGSTVVTGSNNTVTDGGIVKQGLAYLTGADQANTDRLTLLLDAGGKVLDSQTQTTAAAVQDMQTLLQAQQSTSTPADQKTLMNMALIAAGAFVLAKVMA